MCRSFVGKFIENGEEKVTGRFNLGVTTVILPYAALKAKGDKEQFFKELDYLCEKADESNMIRVERMKGTKASVSPILWQYGAIAKLQPDDIIDPLFYDGRATLSLGYAGLWEAQEVLGDTSKEFGIEVMKFLKNKCDVFTERSHISTKPYGSPFENGCYSAASKLKKTFPEWEFDREFITNSFHRPVFADLSILGKFEAEGGYYKYTAGGNVQNIELPNMSKNIAGLGDVVRAAYYNDAQYLIVNEPVDVCYECGYEGEFEALEDGYYCPICGNNNPDTANCIRRVSGYTHSALSRPANKGKYQEQSMRKKNM